MAACLPTLGTLSPGRFKRSRQEIYEISWIPRIHKQTSVHVEDPQADSTEHFARDVGDQRIGSSTEIEAKPALKPDAEEVVSQ